jgi:hypothetical protein
MGMIVNFFVARNRLCAFPNLENASLALIQGKDVCIEAKMANTCSGNRFKVRQCAQSISRIEKPL